MIVNLILTFGEYNGYLDTSKLARKTYSSTT